MDLKEKVIERRHDEVLVAMKNVATALKSLQPKEDVELKNLFAQNKAAINNFVKVYENISNPPVPQITLNQKEVVESINNIALEIGTIMKGIDKRLEALENKPLAVKMKAVRNEYSQEIEYVIIEYKK